MSFESKSVTGDAAPTSTLGAGETRQISPINEQNGGVPSLISYPARPLQGGKLDRAPKKIGLWYAQPKYNGWRAVVHCPSGTMWNRHGGRLTIAHDFATALQELKNLSAAGLIWADCEAMERRHAVGRRSLIVLDLIPDAGSPCFEERREFLESLLPLERMSLGEGTMPEESVLLAPSIADTNGQTLQFYRSLETINRSVLADVFEGVVMKRAVSAYPVQLRRPDEKCRFWQKHRFLM
jgi:ATP-dependent DNA ligase